jgi:chemotaxis signal transduction protein
MDTGPHPSSAASPPPSSRREGESSRRSGGASQGLYACVFWLGGQRYALDTLCVLEAITLTQVASVPLSPPWLFGLTSLRGTPVPVVDLPAVLALPTRAAHRAGAAGQPALVLRVDGVSLAGTVDRIEAVYAFDAARLAPATSAAEHSAVRGLLEVGASGAPATLLDHAELGRKVNEMRFRAKWEQESRGERNDVAKS